MKNALITFEQAKGIAEKAAMASSGFDPGHEIPRLLEDSYVEAEHCWIFLRNRDIEVAEDRWFEKAYGAYAISKTGSFSQITDFSGDHLQLIAYVQIMSDYFKKLET